MGPLKIPITSEKNILNLNQIVIVVENFFFQYDTLFSNNSDNVWKLSTGCFVRLSDRNTWLRIFEYPVDMFDDN